jgi:GNAT superfamily N-acetyltransferase
MATAKKAARATARPGAPEESVPRLRVLPVTPARWPDLVELFGPRGACGGCWCMTPRLSRAEYERSKGEGNKRKLRALVQSGTPPGLLGYVGRKPVAWISVEPRERFGALARSRVAKPVDARPVWSIVCLLVARDQRGRGVSVAMIDAAARYAAAHGVSLVEAYPVDPKTKPMPAVFAWTGILSAYQRAGFREVARRSATRPVVRREL